MLYLLITFVRGLVYVLSEYSLQKVKNMTLTSVMCQRFLYLFNEKISKIIKLVPRRIQTLVYIPSEKKRKMLK